MARRKTASTITPKMYRNFALATIAITGTIALIADGEKREAVAAQIERAEAYAQRPKDTGPVLKMNGNNQPSEAALSGFYHDAGSGGFSGGDGSGGVVPLELREYDFKIDPKRLAFLGLTPAEFAALSDAEKQQVLTMLNGGVTPRSRQRMIAEATASSARRSGQETESADY